MNENGFLSKRRFFARSHYNKLIRYFLEFYKYIESSFYKSLS